MDASVLWQAGVDGRRLWEVGGAREFSSLNPCRAGWGGAGRVAEEELACCLCTY